MPERNDAPAAQEEADELAKRRSRTKAARASRNKIVGHIAQLTAPCTLYRMQGSGSGKANRMWVADLGAVPTVAKVQRRHGGGRFVLVDCNSDRFAFNLAALPDEPEPVPEPETEAETAAHYSSVYSNHRGPPPGPSFDPMTGQPHPPQIGPFAAIAARFDPMTGQALQPQPGWGSEVAQGMPPPPRYDPMTGRPIPAPAWGGDQPYYFRQPAYHRPEPQPQGESSGMRLLLDEVRALRAQAIERPIPPASDFGGQMTAMFTAFDLLDKMKNRFMPETKNDEDEDEPAWLAMAERFLPMLMPQTAQGAAPPALAAPAPQANPAAQTHAPLTGEEVQNARQMLAQLTAINPAMTLEKLCELGERAGIAHRQSVHLFHSVLAVLNSRASDPEPAEEEESEDEEYSEDESWSEEESGDHADPAPATPIPEPPTPVAPTLAAPPSNGPESTPAGPKPASGPSGNLPPLPTNETTRAAG
jgi:hypothetical protein